MDLLSVVSAALDRAPQVQLVALDWQVTPAPGGAGGAAGGSAGGAAFAAGTAAPGRTGSPGMGSAGHSGAAGGSPGANAGARAAGIALPVPGTAGDTGSGADSVPSALLGIPLKPRQSLRIEAEVRLAQADARGAVDSMNGFAQELARDRRLAVSIEKPVLDVRPDVKLSGRAASEAPPPAPFTLRLEYTP
jgi:hypothetical protein